MTLHNVDIRPRRFRRTARAVGRLERHPLLLGLGVAALVAAAAWISVVAINGVPFESTFPVSAVLPADAPLLKDGDEVRIAGQRAGQVRAVRAGAEGPVVDLALDEGPVGRDATATVRLRGLAGSTYIELDPGDNSAPLTAGGTIGPRSTSTDVELQRVIDLFGKDTRASLSTTLDRYGAGLLGGGRRINSALADLPDALTGATSVLEAADPAPGELGGLLGEARHTARGLAAPGSSDLGAVVADGDSVIGAVEEEADALGATIDALRPFEDQALATLPEADPVLDDLSRTAHVLRPGVDSLERTLPDLNHLLGREGALRELSDVADAANPVLAGAEPLLEELRDPVATLKPLAAPLGPLSSFVSRYKRELVGAPTGFTKWGGFEYPFGQAPGAKAIRFSVILTCHKARDPYPKPGAAADQEEACK